MAFSDQTGIGQNFYGDQSYQDITNLNNLQSQQSLAYGDQAAKYADPFAPQRGQYQKQLSDLLANPGSFSSSPAYQFAYNQGLDAVQRKGDVHSGNKLAQLQQYGQGMASQLYGQQAGILAPLAGATTSSPAAAGLAYAGGTQRSQDYAQQGAASKAYGQQQAQQQPPNNPYSIDAINARAMQSMQNGNTSLSALPYSGIGGQYGGMSGQVDYGTPGYTPSAYAGTGYATTGGNTTNFGYDPYSDPYWGGGVASDVLGDDGGYA